MDANINLRFLIFLAAIGIVISACQAEDKMSSTSTTPTPFTPEATATQTPSPTVTPTKTITPFLIEGGTPIKVISGGFSYAPLKGFNIESTNHEVFMISPDKSVTVLISAIAPQAGDLSDNALKNFEEYLDNQIHLMKAGEHQRFEHKAVQGVSVDVSGEIDGKKINARAAYLRPPKGKRILILVSSHGQGKWISYGEQAYTMVLESISFFDIGPLSNCPISTNPEYGITKERPIKIGGDEDSSYREDQYLSSLLSPLNEPVAYFRKDTITYNDTVLDQFQIRYGTKFKILYIDTHNYETPKAPFGLTCSSPFPTDP